MPLIRLNIDKAIDSDTFISQIEAYVLKQDILPINHVKECVDIVAVPLSDAINDCCSTGSFPDELKCAKIIPIFTNGDSLSTGNYRPISILSDFSKIIKQCIFERIYSFTSKCGLINERQFGFQRKSGTLSAAICLLNDVRLSIDQSNKNIAACLFQNVSKAYATILHDLLMNKLYRYGFRGNIYNLVNSSTFQTANN